MTVRPREQAIGIARQIARPIQFFHSSRPVKRPAHDAIGNAKFVTHEVIVDRQRFVDGEYGRHALWLRVERQKLEVDPQLRPDFRRRERRPLHVQSALPGVECGSKQCGRLRIIRLDDFSGIEPV